MSYNQKADRTYRINGSVQIAGMTAQFVQEMNVMMDASSFQRDSTGTGQSVFTQNSDVVGTFDFLLKNTISLYDPAATPVLQSTVSYWMQAIADYDPAIIDFIQTFNAPESAGTIKNARIQFTGRVMKVGSELSVDDGIGDIKVEGEITMFASARRA